MVSLRLDAKFSRSNRESSQDKKEPEAGVGIHPGGWGMCQPVHPRQMFLSKLGLEKGSYFWADKNQIRRDVGRCLSHLRRWHGRAACNATSKNRRSEETLAADWSRCLGHLGDPCHFVLE